MNPNQQANISSYDPVPEITRKHFEEALRTARKSVTASVKIHTHFNPPLFFTKLTTLVKKKDLNKFEQFKKKFDPSFAQASVGSSGPKINWPSSNSNVLGNNSTLMKNEDDDLYS